MASTRWVVRILPWAVIALGACADAHPPPSPGDRSGTPPATPVASQPAAGICGAPSGGEVLLVLEPGMPDPRCSLVTPRQHLRVVNRTGGPVTISIGEFTADLANEAAATFPAPFGDYLLPGVHLVRVDPCCGGALWLKPEAGP